MICGKCGADNEEFAKVCSSCGSEFAMPEEQNQEEVPAVEEVPVVEEVATDSVVTAEEEIPVSTEMAEAEEVLEDAVESADVSGAEPKKSLVKKWWFWAIIGAVVVALILILTSGTSSSSSSSGSSSGSGMVSFENTYVTIVKTTVNSNYGISYGSAFNSFFSRPTWRYFEASTGEDVVEFEGGFYYDDMPATATIQFVVDLYEGTLEVYHLSINDVAQSRLMLATLLEVVFESY